MSIKEMIQDHPQVGEGYTDELGQAVNTPCMARRS